MSITGIPEEMAGKMRECIRGACYIDDRTYVFPGAFNVLSKLPEDSIASEKGNNLLIEALYETLPHPPSSMLGEDRYRQADGGRNNVHNPTLGQAKTQYARNVQGKHPLVPHSLPDPNMVYEELLKGGPKREAHPGGNSSLTFAFASLVTHSLFRTDPSDWNKNNTSSYLDLSPLYGSDQKEQDKVRLKDGRGLLYPDTFSEGRIVFLPPASAALLVIWSRNHNFIATNILKINEQKRWSNPPPEDKAARDRQDEEIFQTARLVNCGSFMSVIFGDYVSGFLGLSRSGSSWSMKPFDAFKGVDDQPVGRGEGNHCSVEFNLLYRWHAVTSEADEKWTQDMFRKLFGDKPFGELNLGDFYQGLGALRNGTAHPDLLVDEEPRNRNFGGIKRGPDGRFTDGDLARILHDATDSPASRYGARGAPEVLKIIEVMGMEQGRKWGVCSMNEFRKFLKLKPYKTFEEWNPDPVIANAARKLYGDIENLELYPGLHAEENMKLGPGSGLCAGFTVTRAILADAIALVRGDRFFTTDFTPTNLTSWGFQDVERDPNNGSFGAYLPKLLLRTLPRHYTYNSVYGLFPFFTPAATKDNLTKLKSVEKYDFKRPTEGPIPKVLNDFTAIKHVFNDINKYKVTYGPDMRYLTADKGMFLVFDEQPRHDDERKLAFHALFPSNDVVKQHVEWYRKTARELISSRSITYDRIKGKHINIINDVINPAVVRWSSENLCGIMIKTSKNPNGDFTDKEMYDKLSVLFSCVFRNTEPYLGWELRLQAKKAADIVNAHIKSNLERAAYAPATLTGKTLFALKSLAEEALTGEDAVKPCDPFLKALAASKKPTDQLVATVLGLAVGSSVNYAQAVAQMVDLYMDDKYAKERQHIVELTAKTDLESNQLLVGYYREAARLNPQFPALLRVAAAPDSIPRASAGPLEVKPGDRLFCSFKNAHQDPALFPEPTKIDPRRPSENYSIQATGTHGCPGLDFSEQTIPGLMREIFGLKNLRRAQGEPGILKSITSNLLGTEAKTYVAPNGELSPWPQSLVLVYDA